MRSPVTYRIFLKRRFGCLNSTGQIVAQNLQPLPSTARFLSVSQAPRNKTYASPSDVAGKPQGRLGGPPINPAAALDAAEKGFDSMNVLETIKTNQADEREKSFTSLLKKRMDIITQKMPRSSYLRTDQDWPSVWPAQRTFDSSVVPLPVKMGYQKISKPEFQKLPPPAYANRELMKIPNFLHLTPTAIQRQCEALKEFCTPWPKELRSDEEVEKHFPISFSTSDYVHSGPVIRDGRARIVTLNFNIDSLPLDYHGKDKMIRLLGNRFNKNTRMVTITADRCPSRVQNKDYLQYLLSALFHESMDDWKNPQNFQNFEKWETEKTEGDMERFFWKGSPSQDALVTVCRHWKETQAQLENEMEMTVDPAEKEKMQSELDKIPAAIMELEGDLEESVLQSELAENLEAIMEKIRNTDLDEESNEAYREYGAFVRSLYNFPPQMVPICPYERKK